MNMFERIPTHQQLQKRLADAPSSLPCDTREALVRKIQTYDGLSRREAEMQINAMAAALREFSGPRRTLHLPSFYRTAMNPLVTAPSAEPDQSA